MTLTEQWKKDELEWHKSYYCQNRKGEVTKAICLGHSELHSEELGGTLNIGYWEVLAPVPSYEEWQEEQKSLKVLAEEYCKEKEKNQQLKELHKRLKDTQNLELEVRRENQQLKELLKRCRVFICYEVPEHCIDDILLDKITNAIGEKK